MSKKAERRLEKMKEKTIEKQENHGHLADLKEMCEMMKEKIETENGRRRF